MTGSKRLCAATLERLPSEVLRPSYPPQAAAIGVVHLGVGNFFRAHQAAYLDEAMDAGKPALINAVIDPAAGSESGNIGNLNPQSVVTKKK